MQHADLIVVLNDGKVAEVVAEGAFAKKDSLYSVMWQKQQQQDREALYATTADKVDTKREKTINIKALQCYIYITYE